MPLIVGLGNIGDAYEGTRHNIGFSIIDRLAGTLSAGMEPTDGPFILGVGRFKGVKTILIKPTTLMNNSGLAVLRACRMYHYLPSDILVCYDDINLPTGKIRLRPEGGAGGHNGIQSIIDHLKTESFPRLRFGIGNEFDRGQQSEYVLSRFTEEQASPVAEGVEKAHDACLTFIREGIVHAMNAYN
ncbi:aminoacyl-tRNA hydrolase [Balneolales bacterium ANBcel1]|nr:aminoacyl-tRNA hydrolase [Balneolales bacterium ANBcel1]